MAGFKNEIIYGTNADFSTVGNNSASVAGGLSQDGQLWIGRTAVNAGGTHIDVATLSAGSGISITNGPGTITITNTGGGGGGSLSTLIGNSGAAVESGGAITVPGTTGINTIGAGSTLTISPANDLAALEALTGTGFAARTGVETWALRTLTAGSGISITNTQGVAGDPVISAGATLATTYTADSGSATPNANNLNLLGSGSITTVGAGSTITTELTGLTNHAVLVGAGTTTITKLAVGTNGQVLIGATAADPAFATITSSNSSILFTTGANSLSMIVNGSSVGQTITGNSGGALSPTAGNWNIVGGTVAAGTSPLVTAGSGSTLTINAQRSQAIASADTTKVGLANFDSAAFDVDANGFVQLNGGGIAATSFTVDANTVPGTNPVVPTAAGVVTVEGAAVANHSVVLESRSRAANTFKLEVQYAAAAASTDATKSGVAHFNSGQFTVDANGFVSATGTVPIQFTSDSGTAAPSAGNINILGGPGVTTSASGSTVTINSVVFTDTTATTLVADNGYFATAAGTYTLPASPAQGEQVIVFCDTTGAVAVTANTGQVIRIGSSVTASAGNLTSTARGDTLTMRYRTSGTVWAVVSALGNWTVN